MTSLETTPAEATEPGGEASDALPLVEDRAGEARDEASAPPLRRSRGMLVAIWLLAIALSAAIAGGVWYYLQLQDAQDRLIEQQQRLEEQRDLIEKKETFGAAMDGLVESAAKFDGVLMASAVPWEDYRRLAVQSWVHRWDASELADDTRAVERATAELESRWGAAQTQAATNATGSTYESVIDRLSGGFVESVIDGTDQLCDVDVGDRDVLGCVISDDPYLVHFDASANALPYMTDELRTGIAYHEFAHVLQFTNPVATADALDAFDGDGEVMADCFALTFLDGWTLDHRIWTSDYEYWDVNIGYGKACTGPQQQAVRDWYGRLGVELKPISSGALT
ncbi:hypothetical protein ACFWGP_01600 [Agromyces sp. NPDC127015]|uniref:hypothetical protein n=1 Tax=Agromyces sp. NPDC127015 TaxID=3347108 RepID=UPI003667E280